MEKILPKKWFKAKQYGYGWYPVTWQGWGVVLIYVFAILTNALAMGNMVSPTSGQLVLFFLRFLVLTVCLIIICRIKGEKARWYWGKND